LPDRVNPGNQGSQAPLVNVPLKAPDQLSQVTEILDEIIMTLR
jgi:hypothetical protein